MQEETKRLSLATPIQHQLNQIMGLSIIEENRLAVQPLVEQPMKLITQKTNKQDNSIQFNFTEWPPMLVESSITAFVVLQPKFKHVTKQKAMKWLGSFYRTGKRMPQEKYVIIKEVSQ